MLILGWIIGAFIIGAIGANRKIGFFSALLLSLFLSPLIGAIFVATSTPLDESKPTDNIDSLLSDKSDTAAFLHGQGKYGQALVVIKEILQSKPNEPYALMNAAKLYSLLKQKEPAFNSIHYARENGYPNIEKALVSDDFDYIKFLPEYGQFVSGGYISPYLDFGVELPKVNAGAVGVADELKKLVELKEGGILTNEEFQTQKQKLLNR